MGDFDDSCISLKPVLKYAMKLLDLNKNFESHVIQRRDMVRREYAKADDLYDRILKKTFNLRSNLKYFSSNIY